MSLEVTGYVTHAGSGPRIRIHEGAPQGYDEVQRVRLEQENGVLYVADVPLYDFDVPGRIGEASLSDNLVLGQYEALYDIDEDKLEQYGHRGIMTAAMRVLLNRLLETDIYASNLVFCIQSDNIRSIGLATKLGAKNNGHRYELDLTKLRGESIV